MKQRTGKRRLGAVVMMTAVIVLWAGMACAATIYDDAIGYWKFDDGTTSDSGSSNLPGTVEGATWGEDTGAFGGAYYFDGSDDYIRMYNPSPGSYLYPTITV